MAKAEDECIINYTQFDGDGARPVAVDRNNDVWVGGWANHYHIKLSGVTGERMSAPLLFFGPDAGGYGGFVDGNNVLWSSGGYGWYTDLLWVDLNQATPTPLNKGSSCGNYGLAIDPCSGYVWQTSLHKNWVYVRDSNGNCVPGGNYSAMNPDLNNTLGGLMAQGVAADDSGNLWIAHGHAFYDYSLNNSRRTVGRLKINPASVATPFSTINLPPPYGRGDGHGPTGVAVDAYQKVWVFCDDSDKAMRIDPDLNNLFGDVNLVVDLAWPGQSPNVPNPDNAGPYNYSDSTGYIAIGTTRPSGFWDVVHDSGCEGADWGRLSWHIFSPGTHPTVQVRAADKIVDLPTKPWMGARAARDWPGWRSSCRRGWTGRPTRWSGCGWWWTGRRERRRPIIVLLRACSGSFSLSGIEV